MTTVSDTCCGASSDQLEGEQHLFSSNSIWRLPEVDFILKGEQPSFGKWCVCCARSCFCTMAEHRVDFVAHVGWRGL